MRAASLPLCGFLIATAAAPAQDRNTSFVSVSDLVTAPVPGGQYLTPLGVRGRRLIAGEEAWLQRSESDSGRLELREHDAAWFDPSQLSTVLARLLQVDNEQVQVLEHGAQLAVRGRLAKAAIEALARLREAMPPIVRTAVEVVRLRDGKEEVLLTAPLTTASGRRSYVEATETRNCVVDYDVEIAQGSEIGNPRVLPVQHGCVVMLRPYVASSEPEGWFELLVRLVEPGDMSAIDTGSTSCGAIDRVQQHVREFAGIVHCQLGVRTVQRWVAADGAAIEVRVTPNWQVPAPGRPAGSDVAYVPAWNGLAGFRTIPWTDADSGDDEPTAPEAEFAAALHAANVQADLLNSGAALAVEGEADILRGLVRARHENVRPVGLLVDLYDAPAGVDPGAGGAPDLRQLGSLRVHGVVDSWACATAYDELTVLSDWSVEVAQSARIPDPQCQRLAAGLFVNARCSGSDVELDGEVSWRGEPEAREIRLGRTLLAPAMNWSTGSGATVTLQSAESRALPDETVRVESMRVHRLPFAIRLPLRREQAAVWRSASTELGPGREFVVTVRRDD